VISSGHAELSPSVCPGGCWFFTVNLLERHPCARLAAFLISRDVERGIFPLDWAGDVSVVGEFGEAL